MSILTAAAGHHGADVRSDCWVQVAEADAPGLRLTSRVEALYGDSIRALVTRTLEALGAADLAVTVIDSGALPYTLMARIEAAVHALRPGVTAEALPDINVAAQMPAEPQRLRRSRLYLPGNVPKFFINAGLHRPDAVILDLEDSVPPAEKPAARLLVRNALRAVSFYGAEKLVRLNTGTEGLAEARRLAPHGAHTFLLPKVESAGEVQAVAAVLDEAGRPEIRLVPIIESPRGAFNALEIAGASARVAALAIGLEDYTTNLGAQRTAHGQESLWALGQVVNAARAAGVQPLASVYSAVDDLAGLQAWVERLRALGFEGVGCLHPRQIAAVHAGFRPRPEEVAEARRVVDALEAAQATGLGAVAVDGRMVDAPVAERARRLLRLAEAAA